jgi:uncharacterized protein (TIGR02444 family)
MSTGFPDDPFWDFSLTVYGADGVPPACLELQGRYQIDVNLLLWCVWCGAEGYPALDAEDLANTESQIGDWHHNVVRHIRWLRQHLKNPYSGIEDSLQQSLRARLQKIEIDAEHLEQLSLAGISRNMKTEESADHRTRIGVSAANGALYLRAAGAEPDGEDAAAFATILSAAYGEYPTDAVLAHAHEAMGASTST